MKNGCFCFFLRSKFSRFSLPLWWWPKCTPLMRFLTLCLFGICEKTLHVCKIGVKQAIFANFAIRARFFDLQKANLQGCGAFFACSNGRLPSNAPQKGSKSTPVVEKMAKKLQNIRKKADFSIDIGFWIWYNKSGCIVSCFARGRKIRYKA